jgi:hypothetical protein
MHDFGETWPCIGVLGPALLHQVPATLHTCETPFIQVVLTNRIINDVAMPHFNKDKSNDNDMNDDASEYNNEQS